ncbi:HAD family hydrolase [Salinivibrio sp. AR640]|uniref:HAD family hydrolase n=1 Tax=Salinivibrio sp. AR640 TaxID=1909437 RepID=UPI0009868340|nr:HAD-IIB family hydrolase [Salinivibrio sp. AR640]
MPIQCLPLSSMHQHAERWRDVQWLFTDVDDTLTWQGALPWQTLKALTELRDAGIRVVPVTGACAGWCDHIINAWPVDAVIGENGGVVMWHENGRRQTKISYTAQQAQPGLRDWIDHLLEQYPNRTLSTDQAYRHCEVAIDIGQHTQRAPQSEVDALLEALHAYGAKATASSIHINAWLGTHNKQQATLDWLLRYGVTEKAAPQQVAFIGDSRNDNDMFAYFPLSVGVANIAPHLAALDTPPTWITEAPGGLGFAEFASCWLSLVR